MLTCIHIMCRAKGIPLARMAGTISDEAGREDPRRSMTCCGAWSEGYMPGLSRNATLNRPTFTIRWFMSKAKRLILGDPAVKAD